MYVELRKGLARTVSIPCKTTSEILVSRICACVRRVRVSTMSMALPFCRLSCGIVCLVEATQAGDPVVQLC